MTGTGNLDGYDLKSLERSIAEDGETSELGVQVSAFGERIVVRGHVSSGVRRDEVLARVRAACPQTEVVDELTCADGDLAATPRPAEEIR